MTSWDDLGTEGKSLIERGQRFLSGCVAIRETTADQGDPFYPTVAIYRDGKNIPCAVALCPGDPETEAIDQLLKFLPIMARGFDGDLIAVAMDTYQTSSPVNPLTGEHWSHGEMHISYQLGTSNAVEEALVVYFSTPDGRGALSTARYGRTPTGGVRWLGPKEQEPNDRNDAEDQARGAMIELIEHSWDTERLVYENEGSREYADEMLIGFLTLGGVVISNERQMFG